MNIIRAEHLGMCFGVRDAIALAEHEASRRPITILGELVHNQTVMAGLQEKGVEVRHDPAEVKTPTVLITAHGASDKMMGRARAHGLHVMEATCPLVHYAHRAVRKLVAEGYHPVIVGKRDHVEVRGMTEDLSAFDVVACEEDVLTLQRRARYGVVAQTTQPVERVRHLANLIQQQFPDAEVRVIDTVCQPTKQRQKAAIDLARHCDVVVVIGGSNSNNTRELVATCRRECVRVHHVQTAADLRGEWFEGKQTVGLTAGTSTPDIIIDAVENRIRELAVTVSNAVHEPVAVH